jgi:hypothetical protein
VLVGEGGGSRSRDMRRSKFHTRSATPGERGDVSPAAGDRRGATSSEPDDGTVGGAGVDDDDDDDGAAVAWCSSSEIGSMGSGGGVAARDASGESTMGDSAELSADHCEGSLRTVSLRSTPPFVVGDIELGRRPDSSSWEAVVGLV